MLIGLTGKSGAGKSTVARILTKGFDFVELSFAEPVKDLLLKINPLGIGIVNPPGPVRVAGLVNEYGWDVAKREYPEIRKLLQRLGTEGCQTVFGEDVWVNLLAEKLSYIDREKDVVISDVRFSHEADFLREYGDYCIIEVNRKDEREWGRESLSHVSEAGLDAKYIDGSIENTGDIIDLYRVVSDILPVVRSIAAARK